MLWLGITIGVALLILTIGVLARRRAGENGEDRDAVNVDPLFTTGIAIAGAGVALATTIGSVMYLMMAVGLIVMATGAYRTRRQGSGRPSRDRR